MEKRPSVDQRVYELAREFLSLYNVVADTPEQAAKFYDDGLWELSGALQDAVDEFFTTAENDGWLKEKVLADQG